MSAPKKPRTASNATTATATTTAPTSAVQLVDIISILSDAHFSHFHGLLPRVVALGCRELADLVFAGRFKLKGILVRSPSANDSSGKQLAEIRAGYARYRTWYPNLYTVVGVTATAPLKTRLRAPFYTFYDEVLVSNSCTIKTLNLDLLGLFSRPFEPEPCSPFVLGFLDSVRLCTETTNLSFRMRQIGSCGAARKAEAVIEYMYNLEHLSFYGFDYDPFIVHSADPTHSKHILYNLPPTLVSLCLAGRVPIAMARHNERAIAYLFDKDMLPSLVSVDLTRYRVPMRPPREAPGLMMRLAHHNSRVSRVLLPCDAEATYYSTLCLRKLLEQGHFLAQRWARGPLTVVVAEKEASVAEARMASIRRTIADYDIQNVLVESMT